MWYDLKFNESAVKNKIEIFAQQLPLYFMPSFSQRVIYLSSELALAVQELDFSNQEFAKLSTEGCNCRNMQSQCRQGSVGVEEVGVTYCTAGGVFGNPCPEEVRKKIEEKQSEIKSKAAQISRLRQLLIEETKILKPEADEELRENLETLLEESRKIIEFGENASNLYCNLNQCHADCSQGFGFDFMACLNPGVQKPIEIKFKGGVSLADLKLGDVIIRDINLGLPATIETPQLGELPSFRIDLPELTINFPQVEVASVGARTTVDISHQPIVFNTPSPPMVPKAPLLELTCPDFNFPDYLPPKIDLDFLEGEFEKAESIENNWFFETFSWLMEKCQEIPAEISRNNVIFYEAALLPLICADLSYPCDGRDESTLPEGGETTEASAEELAAAAEEAAVAAAEAAVAAEEAAVAAAEAAARAEELAAAAEAAPEEEKAAAEAAAAEAAAAAVAAAEAAADAAEVAAAAAETAVEAAAEAAAGTEGQEIAEEICLTDPCAQMKKDCNDAKKKCDKDQSWADDVIGFFTGDPCKKAKNQCLAMSRDLLLGVPDAKCYDAVTAYTAVVNKCDALWQQYPICTSIYRIIYHNTNACTLPAICQSLGSPAQREASQKAQCEKLFQEQGETVPANCNLALLQDRCDQLKEEYVELIETGVEVENLPAVPEPCKFLPLFTGEFSIPEEYESPEYSVPSLPISQKMFNYPASLPGCSSSYPTVLKISFPKVKIRDINLPKITLRIGSWSIVDIRFPSFKFEDLVLPDWELCNLNNCANMFPDFKFQLPYLDIPEIKIPPVDLGELNIDIGGGVTVVVPLPDVELSGIQYSVTPFKLSKLPNLGNLITPKVEYNWPGMPRLKTTFRFSGVDFNYGWGNFLGTLLDMILAWLKFDVSGCIEFSKHLDLPSISFVIEDFVFSWPEFPKLPEIGACKDLNQFCGNMKNNLQQVSNQIEKIEETVNLTLQKEIQMKLDAAALEINQELASIIKGQINQRVQEIIKEIEDHINANYQLGICIGDFLPFREEVAD